MKLIIGLCVTIGFMFVLPTTASAAPSWRLTCSKGKLTKIDVPGLDLDMYYCKLTVPATCPYNKLKTLKMVFNGKDTCTSTTNTNVKYAQCVGGDNPTTAGLDMCVSQLKPTLTQIGK